MQGDTLGRGERRWTAVLCADLVDFTGLSKKLGPERTYELMRNVVGTARTEIEAQGGYVIEYAGDALFAVFGAPKAAENASLDACRAALSIQKQIKSQVSSYDQEFGLKPTFRIGIAGGSVVFGSLGHGERLDINVLGDAVNLAMRLQKETPSGTVICSDSIHNQVEGFADFENNGPTKIKGYTESHTTHTVLALNKEVNYFKGRLQRGSDQFFGREKELVALNAWMADDTSPMIEVTGPAGAGKSRLIHEFTNHGSELPRIIVGQCNLNIQQSPLAPIIEILRKAIDWNTNVEKKEIETHLVKLISAEGPAFSFILRRIQGLEADRSEQFVQNNIGVEVRRLCSEALRTLSRTSNVIYLIEDAHWIDASSEAIINGLVEENSSPVCRFIVTRRSHILCRWTNEPGINELALTPLSPASVKDLILVMLNVATADEDLISLVDEKSERNPLFVEEIVRYLVFSGAIEKNGPVARLSTQNKPNIISGNLQHLVLSRFDALPTEDRNLLIVASARGRQFSTIFLAACAEPDANTDACISHALEAGLIENDPTRGEGRWRFSHALIGNAIYQSLLGPDRRDVHTRIAETLEAGIEGSEKASANEIATHFLAAGNNRKAIFYLWQSAQKAYEIFSVILVDQQLDQAFTLIEAEPDLVDDQTFGQMLFLWGRTLDMNGHFNKLHNIMERHLPRLRRIGPSNVLSLCLSMNALSRCHAAEYHRAQEQLDEALSMAQSVDEEIPIILAKVVQMRINVDSGFTELSATAALYKEVKPIAERLKDGHLIQLATYVMMTAYRAEGALKRANEYVDWLSDFGTKNKSTRAIAMAHWARCINHLIRDQVNEAIVAADQNLELTVVDTADWRIAVVGKTVARLGRGDEDISPDTLLPLISTLVENDDTTLGNAARGQYWIQLMNRGHLHKGWTGFSKLKAEIKGRSTAENRRFFELVAAEVIMSVGGIIPRNGSRPKLGILDLFTAITLKINARAKARSHLEKFLEMAPTDRGYFVARINRNFGLIEKSTGNLAKSDEYFSRSIALYEAEDMYETALVVEKMRKS